MFPPRFVIFPKPLIFSFGLGGPFLCRRADKEFGRRLGAASVHPHRCHCHPQVLFLLFLLLSPVPGFMAELLLRISQTQEIQPLNPLTQAPQTAIHYNEQRSQAPGSGPRVRPLVTEHMAPGCLTFGLVKVPGSVWTVILADLTLLLYQIKIKENCWISWLPPAPWYTCYLGDWPAEGPLWLFFRYEIPTQALFRSALLTTGS